MHRPFQMQHPWVIGVSGPAVHRCWAGRGWGRLPGWFHPTQPGGCSPRSYFRPPQQQQGRQPQVQPQFAEIVWLMHRHGKPWSQVQGQGGAP